MQAFLNCSVKIPNSEIVDGSRNDSAYHPSEVDQMSTFNSRGLGS